MLFGVVSLNAQSVKPRIKITSDTSNWCQQSGSISWEIYDSANGNATLQAGSISIPSAASTTAVCYKSVKAEIDNKLVDYIANNSIMEADGTLPAYTGTYAGGGGSVLSVFGRTGAVVKQAGDYLWGDIGSKPATFAPSAHTHGLADVTDEGTAAALNVPASGDAAAGEIVKGDDTRLTNARTPIAHNHAGADINTGTVADARLSPNVSLLGSTVGGTELGNPAVGTKGGVEAKACSGTDKVSAIGTDGVPVCSADQSSGGGLPSGAVVLILSGSCPATLGAGWTEAALGGKFLLVTTNGAGDIGGTGGQDTVTSVINHTHGVNVNDPQHAHVENNNSATTGGLAGWAARDTSTSTPVATGYSTAAAATGITATTNNPAGGVASVDNRPSFVRVILCQKD